MLDSEIFRSSFLGVSDRETETKKERQRQRERVRDKKRERERGRETESRLYIFVNLLCIYLLNKGVVNNAGFRNLHYSALVIQTGRQNPDCTYL